MHTIIFDFLLVSILLYSKWIALTSTDYTSLNKMSSC